MSENLKGLIERVTFHNPENGFAVLKVKVKGHNDLVTVIGTTTSVTAGEHLEATGSWVVDREHGQQFKADCVKTAHPSSPEGIERYLSSGAIRSIGPKLAAKIVSIYQGRTLEILDRSPDFLLHIRGIGQARLKRIRHSWEEQREVRKIMLFFTEHGISSARAVRIYRTYGHEAIAKIKANPYQIADDIRGIGFKTADELAAKLGIDRNSPHRARAAVQYALQQLAAAGHCGYPETGVVEHTSKLVEIDRQIVEEAVAAAVGDGSVVREPADGDPWLFLQPLHRAEVGLARSVHSIAGEPGHPLPQIDMDKAIGWVEAKLGIELAAGQPRRCGKRAGTSSWSLRAGLGSARPRWCGASSRSSPPNSSSASWPPPPAGPPSGWPKPPAAPPRRSTACSNSTQPPAISNETSRTSSRAICSCSTKPRWSTSCWGTSSCEPSPARRPSSSWATSTSCLRSARAACWPT